MAESLDEKFPYSLEMIVYDHFSGDSLDYREVKTLGTTLWIIKWSNGFNEVDCYEIAKRAIANYGLAFDFDEKEAAWAIIRLLVKGILSSVFMGPVEDLSISPSVIPAIKIVKVNNDELIDDALNYNGSRHKILRRSDHSSSPYLKSRNIQSYYKIPKKDRLTIDSSNMMMQSGYHPNIEEYKN